MGDQQGATRSRLSQAFGAVYFRDEDWALEAFIDACLGGPPSFPSTPHAVPEPSDAAEAAPPQADLGHFRSEPPRQSRAYE